MSESGPHGPLVYISALPPLPFKRLTSMQVFDLFPASHAQANGESDSLHIDLSCLQFITELRMSFIYMSGESPTKLQATTPK